MESTQTPSSPPSPPVSLGLLEKLMTWLYDIRLWFTTAARVGQLMARGAYLLGERRRLFVKLGEMVYEKNQRAGEKDASAAEARRAESIEDGGDTTQQRLVHQIDRLTKKLELEEMLIRSARFGVQTERPSRAEGSAE